MSVCARGRGPRAHNQQPWMGVGVGWEKGDWEAVR